jgi:hypothetical protein
MIGKRHFISCILSFAWLSLLIAGVSSAAMITVNSVADPGAPGICALRDAITAANSQTKVNGCKKGSGNDTINFSVSGTTQLADTLPQITDNRLAINGPVTIDGGSAVQVMQVGSAATLNLNDLTIAHGSIASNVPITPLNPTINGGGILNDGTLTVTNSTFTGNTATFDSSGGGIYNEGTLTIIKSTFSDNGSGVGGAIFNNGTLTVTNSTFSDNNGFPQAAGIYNSGTLTVTTSTFSDNRADDEAGGILNTKNLTVRKSTFSGNFGGIGGGIYNIGSLIVKKSTFSANIASVPGGSFGAGIYNTGSLIVTNSTFSGNFATHPGVGQGSGIYNGGTLAVIFSTFFGNFATDSGGVANASGSASVSSTIFADSINNSDSGPISNCSGTITDGGYNISDDDSCGFAKTGKADNGDNVNPMLSSDGLINNGGPTQTIALSPGSPAIDAIPLADCTNQNSKRLETDQRGLPRPDGKEKVCDIGAYEFQDGCVANQQGNNNCQ